MDTAELPLLHEGWCPAHTHKPAGARASACTKSDACLCGAALNCVHFHAGPVAGEGQTAVAVRPKPTPSDGYMVEHAVPPKHACMTKEQQCHAMFQQREPVVQGSAVPVKA